MSFDAIRWALGANTTTANERLVLIVLADHAGADTNRCRVGEPLLMTRTHLSARAVRRAIAGLVEHHLVERIRTGRTNAYRLCLIVSDRPNRPIRPAHLAGLQNQVLEPIRPRAPKARSGGVFNLKTGKAAKAWSTILTLASNPDAAIASAPAELTAAVNAVFGGWHQLGRSNTDSLRFRRGEFINAYQEVSNHV